jgi:hypothetical protein
LQFSISTAIRTPGGIASEGGDTTGGVRKYRR